MKRKRKPELIGTELKNGAIVIDAYYNLNTVYVLCITPIIHIGGITPYVTWMYDEENGDCYHGHYFYDLAKAVENLNERTKYRERSKS